MTTRPAYDCGEYWGGVYSLTVPSGMDDMKTALDACLETPQDKCPCPWSECQKDPGGDGGASNSRKGASPSVIIVSCVAAAVVLVAALFVWNKRQKATKQPHREASMPTIGDDGA